MFGFISKLALILCPRGCPVGSGVARQPGQEGHLSAGLLPHFPYPIDFQVPGLCPPDLPPALPFPAPKLEPPARWVCDLYSTQDPIRGRIPCLVYHSDTLQIPNTFWTRDPAFPFCTGPHTLYSWSCPWMCLQGPTLPDTGPCFPIPKLSPRSRPLQCDPSEYSSEHRAHLLSSKTFKDNLRTI